MCIYNISYMHAIIYYMYTIVFSCGYVVMVNVHVMVSICTIEYSLILCAIYCTYSSNIVVPCCKISTAVRMKTQYQFLPLERVHFNTGRL